MRIGIATYRILSVLVVALLVAAAYLATTGCWSLAGFVFGMLMLCIALQALLLRCPIATRVPACGCWRFGPWSSITTSTWPTRCSFADARVAITLSLPARRLDKGVEDTITATELLLLLLIGGGPVYLVSALIQLRALRRARTGWLRVALAVLGSVLVALPLTVAVWWASGFLPVTAMPWIAWAERADHALPFQTSSGLLVIAAFVAPPALLASALAFPLSTWLARRELAPRRPLS